VRALRDEVVVAAVLDDTIEGGPDLVVVTIAKPPVLSAS
jgi:hypothetical protein